MSNTKSIQIIGGGLYGCLTAYHIAKKFPHYKVDLIEAADHLMTAFDPISLSGVRLNNGFHGLEVPRSQQLFEFITDVLGVAFKLQKNDRFLSIKGHLIPYDAPLSEWPSELQADFLTPPPFQTDKISDFWYCLSPDYKNFLTLIGHRYSESIQESENLLVPWFFPADYILLSEDEGNVFRNDVRAKKINALYAYPENHVFATLQDAMADTLASLGVTIHLSTKVDFSNNALEYKCVDGTPPIVAKSADKIFFCASLAIMLKDINMPQFKELISQKRKLVNALLEYDLSSEKLRYFSEVLCADECAPYIARISVPTKFGATHVDGKGLLQVEMFLSSDEDLESIQGSLPQDIARILSLSSDGDVNLLDVKVARDVFSPAQDDLTAASETLSLWADTYYPQMVIKSGFKPINMAKTWIWAEENAKSLNPL